MSRAGAGPGLRAAQVRARVARPGAGPGRLRMARADGERVRQAGRRAAHAGREIHAGHERAVAAEVAERVAVVGFLGGLPAAVVLHLARLVALSLLALE